jgi:nucleoside-triphosphatase THEP1
LLGINPAGMILGGMLAVFSALIHKAVNLLILYGWDLARLFDRLVVFASKQLGIESMDGWDLLMILGGIYLLAGAVAAIAGMALGSRTLKVRSSGEGFEVNSNPESTLFNYSDPGKYSAWLLLLHILLITGFLVAFNRLKGWYVPLLPLPYLLFCFIRYRRSLRQLFRIKLWIQLVLITFLASIFLVGLKSGHWFSREGLEAGLMMNLRAVLLLTGFSAISTEMKNPVIRTILYNRGFAPLYKSLSLAFAVLPEVVGSISDKGSRLRGMIGLIERQILRADSLYEKIREMGSSLPKITIVTGERGEGKTTWLRKHVDDLKASGTMVAGFIAEGIHTPEGERIGYRIVNIITGEQADFCMLEGSGEWERVGRFRINPDGLAAGYRWMDPGGISEADLLVIDEVGPLELAGKGWAPLIERILRDQPKPMIWTARRQLAGKIGRKWNVGETTYVDIRK